MRCPHCGMEINELDKFCKNCGKSLVQDISSPEEPIILETDTQESQKTPNADTGIPQSGQLGISPEPKPHKISQQPKNIPELLKKAQVLESEGSLS